MYIVSKVTVQRQSSSWSGSAALRIGGALIALSTAFGSARTAQASCGDWLQHSSSQPASHRQGPEYPTALPARPICQGPGCSQTPQREQPTPTSPVKLIRTNQEWAAWLELA